MFVCLTGEDHVVKENGRCLHCASHSQVFQFCSTCHLYVFGKRKLKGHIEENAVHKHIASLNRPDFVFRCNRFCGRSSWSDYDIATHKCSCGGSLEKRCLYCSEFFSFKQFSKHVLICDKRSRSGRVSARLKADPPKRSREKAAEATAAKPLKKKEKKNRAKKAEEKDAVKKKAVTKKANKKMGMPNVAPAASPAPAPAPAPARNASFVDFVQSFRSKQKDVAAVAEVLKIVTDQMLDSEFFEQVDDQLFSELEQGRPIGVKQLLRKIREESKK